MLNPGFRSRKHNANTGSSMDCLLLVRAREALDDHQEEPEAGRGFTDMVIASQSLHLLLASFYPSHNHIGIINNG